jgi:glucose-1-phosphate thymidylyltransferase
VKCLILAGGFATRLYPLTLDRAKALLPYRGRPVISHILGRIPDELDVIVSTNRKFEADFRKWQQTAGRPVEICTEEAEKDEHKLGAVGAIDFWIKNKNIDDDLMIIAADNYFEFDLAEMISGYNHTNAMVAVYEVGDRSRACEIGRACQVGLVTLEGTRIVRFDEKP